MSLDVPAGTRIPPPVDQLPRLVHALVEAQARRTPERVALSCAGRHLSYAEVERAANRVAHRLRRHGVGPEVPVGVYLERGPELVVAMLGVLKAGGAYVPLDPAYPRARVEAILADTRLPLVVTEAALAGRLPATGAAVVSIDDPAIGLDGLPDTPPDVPVDPDNLSHVIHTSGSTGRPKGVMIRHAAVAALIEWGRGALGIGEGTAVLASTSACFDVHVAETWLPLALGARVVLVGNALDLAALPAGEAVEVASMVPSAAAELLRMGALPRSLRSLNLGGEPVRPELLRDLLALPDAPRILNLWGPTEDTTYSTCAVLDRACEPVPIGRAVAGTVVRVLDPKADEVEDGAEGELFVAGAGLARGYVGAPRATAERWLPDPFGEPGARAYRVGDRGRRRADGALDCLGRVDHQVKVRGFRVELGEVEAALRAHPAVGDAVAAVRTDAGGGAVLAGYVVAIDGAAPSNSGLRAFLAARLPEYMVPTALAVLDALPRLPNGKVDRGALPQAAPEDGASGAYRAPSTPAEAAVCRIWEEVLGAGRVGADDDFFEMGGHSLRATQVVSRIRAELGAALSPFALFALRTPADLARAAERAGTAEDAGVPPLAPADRSGAVPLSFSQQAIWFLQELSPGMTSYNFQARLDFDGALDVAALERSLSEIVRRHEIFRTEFRVVDGAPRQVVREPWPVSLPVEDLRGAPAGGLEARLEAAFTAPFRLDRLPLVRWSLYRTAEARWTLAVVEHHFVHDGWSFGVFLRELAALYAAFDGGRPSPLAEPELQFGDYALWQRRWRAGAEAARQLAYWKARLSPPVPVLELPADRPRPPVMSFHGRARRHALEPALAARAREAARAHGVTLYTVLLAAYQALLLRYTGQADFAVGGGVANRNERAAEGIIGMIVNTVALRSEVAGDPTAAELLARVHRAVAEAYAHREIPFGEVVEAVQPGRSLGHLPIYQTAFSFHDAPYPDLRLPGVRLEVTEALSNGSAKFDLQVVAIPRASQRSGAGDEVAMIWEYATDLFDLGTVERMEGHYRTLLAALVGSPHARLSALPLMPEAERRAVLAAARGPDAAFDPAPVHRQVERRAERAPDALAVAGCGVSLTYGALDAAANRIAHALLARGAGRGSVVAVRLERSPRLVAALLGVLKSGAAYLPVDPADPPARLLGVLAAAGARVLVTAADADVAMDAEIPVLAVGAGAGIVEARPASPPAVEVDSAELAYVVYTSGSTGAPKGVMVEHRALASLCGWHRDAFAITAADRASVVAAVGFDASAWEIWPHLAAGASLHVAPEVARTEPAALAEWILRERVTVAFLPTPLAERVLAEGVPFGAALRVVLTGGDRLRVRPPVDADFALVNAYGPTECTVVSIAAPVAADGDGLPAIGAPIPGTAAHLLDDWMRPVPDGVAGELYLGGAQVARGYFGRPGLTAERFVPDPFGAAGARLYRSGDRARRQGGALHFLGRADRQVKVRGFRIEPGEVEATLRAHPAVADAAVAGREEGGAARLVAWVVAAAESPDPAVLRAWLAGRLPEHLVPASVAVVPSLPLTVNGKVDLAALPTPAGAPAASADDRPATEVERMLAELVAEVLGVETVGAEEPFFVLGGDSLLAMRLSARAREEGLSLSTRDVFAYQTVRAMAAHAAPLIDALAEREGAALEELLRALEEVEGSGA